MNSKKAEGGLGMRLDQSYDNTPSVNRVHAQTLRYLYTKVSLCSPKWCIGTGCLHTCSIANSLYVHIRGNYISITGRTVPRHG